jgi:hypothetical protein
MRIKTLIKKIVSNLSDDLKRSGFNNSCSVSGHCYVASEAMFHLLGGYNSSYRPANVKHEGVQHWYLIHNDSAILDLTAAQFKTPIPYHRGRKRGFLTKHPSKRAQILLSRIR